MQSIHTYKRNRIAHNTFRDFKEFWQKVASECNWTLLDQGDSFELQSTVLPTKFAYNEAREKVELMAKQARYSQNERDKMKALNTEGNQKGNFYHAPTTISTKGAQVTA